MPSDKDFQLAVGQVYAEALMDTLRAKGGDAIAQAREEIDQLVILWKANEQFRAFCNSVIIDKEARNASLRRMFEGKVGSDVLHLMLVLSDHQRLFCLDEVCLQFQRIRDSQLNRAHVHVTTAVPLDDDLREKIRVKMAALLNKQPILHEHVKPELLGGLVVQVGDRRLDASASRRLNELREHMHAAGRRAITSQPS